MEPALRPLEHTKRIPYCWAQHGGLAAEIATLAYSLAPSVQRRQSQHTTPPRCGTTAGSPASYQRMRWWAPTDCFDGTHKEPRR